MKKHELSDEQEQLRLEGLRTLARIMARHYLAHPDLYPSVPGEGHALDSQRNAAEDRPRRDDVA